MARIVHASPLYELAAKFRTECLDANGSLLFENSTIWTLSNLEELQVLFVDSPDVGERTFRDKFRDQLKPARADVVRLAAEVVLVHFLFPSPSSAKGNTKRSLINDVLGFRNERVDAEHPAMKSLDRGIGGTGQAYNSRRHRELWFVINVVLKVKRLPPSDRALLFGNPWKFRDFVDSVEDAGSRQFRHMLLHLIFPDHFERIASGAHKGMILRAFQGLAGDAEKERDERLYEIRGRLEALLPGKPLDFYKPPLASAWDSGEDEVEKLSPLDALLHKKQIVLYGPPGTGKTHEAKALARRVIHAEALRVLGAGRYFEIQKELEVSVDTRVHRLQLHPSCSYEDFIRGLHVGEGGKTEYRPGYLLRLVRNIEEERQRGGELSSLPHVLILDEMNRTDLSRLLGECFSLLEDRGALVELPGSDADGKPLMLELPAELYVIGTMNLIDKSIEQIDFALRRRFLWQRCGFDPKALVAICGKRWSDQGVKPHTWDVVRKDFERLSTAATALNKAIHDSSLLGEQYEIGHTYFFDVVDFLRRELEGARGKRSGYLWRKNEPEPAIRTLWELSIEPLLQEYLRGLDEGERNRELVRLQDAFFHPPMSVESDE